MGGEWRADPTGRHQERFHDGSSWTSKVRDRGIENIDALPIDGDGGGASAVGGAAAVAGAPPTFGKIIRSAPPSGLRPPSSGAPTASVPADIGGTGPAWTVPDMPVAAASAGAGSTFPPSPPLAPIAATAPASVSAPAVRSGSSAGRGARRVAGGRSLWVVVVAAFCTVALIGAAAGGVVYVVKHRKPTRSTEAFCKTMISEQKRIVDQLNLTAGGADGTGDDFAKALLGVMASVQAIGELNTYFRKLAKVAPAEIQTEAELMADKIGDLTKVPDMSLQGLVGSFMGALEVSGPLSTLNAFATKNCGRPI